MIDSGVYSVVRHPMYAGGRPAAGRHAAVAGIVRREQSWQAFPSRLLAVRILVEEEFLRRELAGYDAYTQRVRHRLIPLSLVSQAGFRSRAPVRALANSTPDRGGITFVVQVHSVTAAAG